MLENFIYARKKSLFESALNNGEVPDEAIAFIKDTKEIWTHGLYYGATSIANVEAIDPETPVDDVDFNMITAAPVEGEAEIKQLKEGDKVIYPLTSTKAIVDEEGNRISILTEERVEEMITNSITNALKTEV